MMESKALYELAFLISPDVAEEEAQIIADDLKSLIGLYNAEIESSDMPRKRRISYLIRNNSEAYLGALRFFAPQNRISEIEKKSQISNKILRIMVSKWKKQPERRRTIKPQEPVKEAIIPTDEKTLDARLEEILGTSANEPQ